MTEKTVELNDVCEEQIEEIKDKLGSEISDTAVLEAALVKFNKGMD